MTLVSRHSHSGLELQLWYNGIQFMGNGKVKNVKGNGKNRVVNVRS